MWLLSVYHLGEVRATTVVVNVFLGEDYTGRGSHICWLILPCFRIKSTPPFSNYTFLHITIVGSPKGTEIPFISFSHHLPGCVGVVMDNDSEVVEAYSSSFHYFHLYINTLGKGINLFPSSRCRMNSRTFTWGKIVLLKHC